MKKLAGLLLLFFCFNSVVAENRNIPLFHIERNKNESIVCYELRIKDNAIDTKEPIHAYWKNPHKNGNINELSLLQKKLAYGVSVKNIDKNTITFTMTAYPERPVKVVYNQLEQKAEAYISINGIQTLLTKMYIHATPPAYRSVEYVILNGINQHSNKKESEQINNK